MSEQVVFETLKYRIVVNEEGTRRYYNAANQLHRIECSNGDKFWYQNGQRHRTDGPAIDRANGHKEWWQSGLRHRIDGPAIESTNGYEAWYINGQPVTETQFNQRVRLL